MPQCDAAQLPQVGLAMGVSVGHCAVVRPMATHGVCNQPIVCGLSLEMPYKCSVVVLFS